MIIKKEASETVIQSQSPSENQPALRVITGTNEVKQTKYLDQEGANELITQFKAYVDSLV